MTLIDGKAIALELRKQIADRVATFKLRHGRSPGLHVVLAGENQASMVYVRSKEKAAAEAGLDGVVHRLPSTVSQSELLGKVRALNADPNVDGILVQLPLPQGLDESQILAEIDPSKDVDGFHAQNVGALWTQTPGLVPCTPRGCLYLIEQQCLMQQQCNDLSGKRALVVGRSNIVGKPVAALLLQKNATVTIAHSKTADLKARCQEAEILVAAVGRAKMIKGDWIRSGAIVIDVGMNRDENGKLCGDVDFEEASERASAITPVPGGVGPMTIAMLLDNTLRAAEAREASR